MKKPFFISVLLCIYMNVSAQSIENREVEFKYNQLPSNPLPRYVKNYESHIIVNYFDEIENEKSKAKIINEKRRKVYENDIEKYNNRLDKWNKKSSFEVAMYTILMRRYVANYIMREPEKPEYLEETHQALFDTLLLREQYLKLNGFHNKKENALKITVTMNGFDTLTPRIYYESQGGGPVIKYYEVQYRHLMNVKIEMPNKTLIDEIPYEFLVYKTKKVPYYSLNKSEFFNVLQNEIVNQNMNFIQHMINSKYGYSEVVQKLDFLWMNDKNNNFATHDSALKYVSNGLYNLLLFDIQAKQNIKKGIDLLESEFYNSDKSSLYNKKAKIAAYFNLGMAYLFVDNFEKSNYYFSELMLLEIPSGYQKKLGELRRLESDLKTRWLANLY